MDGIGELSNLYNTNGLVSQIIIILCNCFILLSAAIPINHIYDLLCC